jgi:hypothetical protein
MSRALKRFEHATFEQLLYKLRGRAGADESVVRVQNE